LKVSVQLTVLSSVGSAFQAEGPATEKARSANLVRVRGMTYELLADERRLEQLAISRVCRTSSRR